MTILLVQSQGRTSLAGLILAPMDAGFGTLSYGLTGQFTRLSQAITSLGVIGVNLSNAGDITRYLGAVSSLNQNHLIDVSGLDYDTTGITFHLQADPSRLAQAVSQLRAALPS